jgi:DNA-binding GntR family transcriptional regulator
MIATVPGAGPKPRESRSDATDIPLSATTPRRVVDLLRVEISRGRLSPGTRMKIDELATYYGVSHMPIREALRELESEGLVEISAHRGATIRGIDEAFIQNIYDIREAIEVMLAERCAQRATPATVTRLREQVRFYASITRRGGSDNTEALIVANRAIHLTINSAAENPQALRVLTNGRALVEALRMSYGFRPPRMRRIVTEHQALLDAITTRDAVKAGAIARSHCVGARDDMLVGYREVGAKRLVGPDPLKKS